MRTIGSVLFIVTGFVAGVLFAAVALLFFWAPRDFLWGFVVNYCRLTLWLGEVLCGLKMVSEGRENLPDGPCVIMMKHSSALETYGHVPFFPKTSWVLKQEILWISGFGWALKLLFEPIAITASTAARRSNRLSIRESRN